MERRLIGRTGLAVSPIGFGAFKIGRNQGIKYPRGYALPSQEHVDALIRGLADLGINYIDTAPAYGVSEERVGRALQGWGDALVVSTKAGESRAGDRSIYDFSRAAIEASARRSLERLGRSVLDLLFVHSDGRDLEIIEHSDAVATMQSLAQRGLVRAIGFSGKTIAGARAALAWADAIMVEYHPGDRSHEPVFAEAAAAGVGVIVKKGLGAGRLDAAEALRFVLRRPEAASVVVGSLSLEHMAENVRALGGGEIV